MITHRNGGRPGHLQDLRLWPGVAAVAVQWIAAFAAPAVLPAAGGGTGILAGVAGGAAVLVWWLFFSRARAAERLGAVVLMVLAIVATRPFLHASVRTGMMGMLFYIYVIPPLSLALVAWAVTARRAAGLLRYATMIAAVVVACGAFTVLRTEGVTGDAESDFEWRWTPTAEERLLARAADERLAAGASGAAAAAPGAAAAAAPAAPMPTMAPAPSSTAASRPAEAGSTPASAPPAIGGPADAPPSTAVDPATPEPSVPAWTRVVWPGFRGAARDGVVRGATLATDWARSPPVELWRRPIGPGWSSFAVGGELFYTQEQRGDEELVSCYRASTGEPVWRHADRVRFWESNGGAGPRGTPTLHQGRVYSLGATGIVNALDAATGAVMWSRDAAADTGTEIPAWGFAGSPLVAGDVVIVAVSGQLAAYDAARGTPRWFGPSRGGGYSSPHLMRFGGMEQVILLSGGGAIGVSPGDGALLWEHTWQPGVANIVQPAAADGDLLVTAADAMGGTGMRRVRVERTGPGWTLTERWTSRGLKPYFNDFVVHEGHAYGFDGSIMACVDLDSGERKWKGGRYGHGQLVLLPDRDLMLVLSEDGELVLVAAAPEAHRELARFKALEGKTWNHPVLAGDVLLVRNGEEMAAFRMEAR